MEVFAEDWVGIMYSVLDGVVWNLMETIIRNNMMKLFRQ